MTRTKLTKATALCLAVTVLLLGCKEQSAKQGSVPPPNVTVVEAKLSDVNPSTGFTGRVEAIDTVELRARVEGYLLSRFVDEGTNVNVGDLLFSIEKDNYLAEIDKVKGTIERLKGTKKLAEIERDRRAKLVKTKSISQEQLDVARAKVVEVNGDLISQNAALRRAELNFSYTDIKAPISGKIGLSPFSHGDFVGPNSGPLAVLVSQDPVYVTFPVSQRTLLGVQKRASKEGNNPTDVLVKIKLADGSLYGQNGVIDFVDIVADPTTDTILIRAEFANPDGLLVHQQLVKIMVQESEPEAKITIPESALQFDQIGKYVLLVDENNKVVVQRIETQTSVNGRAIISKGLSPGQKVIAVGVQKVRPGIEVVTTLMIED